MSIARTSIRLLALSVVVVWSCGTGTAQTLNSALAQAYRNNETLNSERANLRATDEEVPQALSGYRPRIEATADAGPRYLNEKGADGAQQSSTTAPRSVGVTASQSIFNGFQTANRVRAAENQVLAGREALRVMEQTVLVDAATAYMDVLRDAAILELQKRNLDLLGTHPTSAVLSDAVYFAKRVTLSLALRSSGDAGRGFRRVGAAAALVAR
ncbi:TolC family protein (plasmid) [Bradyrhizobium denitrificans]